MKSLHLCCLGTLATVLPACVAPPAHDHHPSKAGADPQKGSLRGGDIVFQDSSPHSGQAEQVKALTKSKWSHCGIYFKQPDGSAVVVDGNGTGAITSWDTWRNRGAGGRFAAYRLRQGLTDEQALQLRKAAERYDRRPYDLKFAWDDGAIYCSELIWKAYRDALGIEVGKVQKLGDFNLDSPVARPLIVREGSWRTVANAKAHADERVISPESIADSSLLIPVR